MEEKNSVEDLEGKRDKFYGHISFWSSIILTTLICYWYYNANPPAEGAMKKMRSFIAKNAGDVSHFLRLSIKEQEAFAVKKKHPFYKNFVKTSMVERGKIRALAHNSFDYKPAQYWVNLVFLWVVFFTTFWFLGLITQGIIQLNRRKNGNT